MIPLFRKGTSARGEYAYMFVFILSLWLFLILPLAAGLIERLLLGILCFPLIFVILNMAGIAVHSSSILSVLSLLLLILTLYQRRSIYRLSSSNGCPPLTYPDAVGTFGFVVFFWGMMELLYSGSAVLPAQDPIAVQSIAYQTSLSGNALMDHFKPGSFHAAYPPAYPIFLSALVHSWCDAPHALMAFKHINLFILSGIPFMWAFFLRRIFSLQTPLLPLVLAFYAAFFCFDRNLPHVLPIVGKNSSLLMAFFFPFAFFMFTKVFESRRAFTLGILALTALTLVHYSALAMMFIAMIAFLSVTIPPITKRNLRMQAVFLSAFFISCMLFALYLHFLPPHRMFSAMSTGKLSEGWPFFVKIFTTPDSNFFFILSSVWGTRSFLLYRGWLLIALLIFLAGINWAFSRSARRSAPFSKGLLDLGFFSGIVVILFVIAAAFAMTKSIIYFDYIRWLSFYFYTSLIAVVLFFLTSMAWANRIIHRRIMGLIILGIVLCIGIFWFGFDCCRFHTMFSNSNNSISFRDLETASSRLASMEHQGPAFLITSSRPVPEGMRFHDNKLLDHIPALTSLRLATGSWMYTPLPHCNSASNFPSRSGLSTLWAQGSVYFIGTRSEMTIYSNAVPNLHFELSNPPLRRLLIAKVSPRTSPSPTPEQP